MTVSDMQTDGLDMDRAITSVVIVGGGTAGWLAACLIAARADRDAEHPLQVTLIESPDVATIGVGEGTWPTMRRTLERIGITETDFLLACDAAFKQGSRFDGWRTGAVDDSYLHPFTAPVDGDPRDLVSVADAAAVSVENPGTQVAPDAGPGGRFASVLRRRRAS